MGKVLIAVLILMAASSPALSKCKCLYQGKRFEQGEIACIRIDGRVRLARCDMVLNNSSWSFLGDGCPTASVATTALEGSKPSLHVDVR